VTVIQLMRTSLFIRMPSWLSGEKLPCGGYDTDAKKMALAIRLAKKSVREKTGGPFGAAIFTAAGGLVSVGVNCVVAQSCSVAHAEIMAIMLAQRSLAEYRLGEKTAGKYILASSAQPCAMCFGALVWSGVTRLLFGALREDVERIVGFDEGPIDRGWKSELRRRGIVVKGEVSRKKACEVLWLYGAGDGALY